MGKESIEGNDKGSQINLEDYSDREGDYKVVLVGGEYSLAGGAKLIEREGELYVADGEDDAGTKISKNGSTIPSGF